MLRCPHCQELLTASDTTEAEVEAVAQALRAACLAAGKCLTGDDRVDEATAAMLVGRKTKTLRNWRHTHRPIPYAERCRRIHYAVSDIARWLHETTGEPA